MCNRILDLSHTPTLEQTLVRRPDPLVTTQYPENALFDGQFVFLYPHRYISVTRMESIPWNLILNTEDITSACARIWHVISQKYVVRSYIFSFIIMINCDMFFKLCLFILSYQWILYTHLLHHKFAGNLGPSSFYIFLDARCLYSLGAYVW